MAVKVKKYDPNEYNFGNFADAMNKNFAIERTQNLGGAAAPAPAASLANPVNLGGKTNSQTLGNLPQIEQNAGGTFPSTKIGKGGIYRDITASYKDMLGKIDLGEQASYTSPFAVKPGAENNTVETEPVVVPEGSTKEATQTVAPTVQSGETSLPQGVPTAPETDISTGKLDFATWQSTYSVDPVEEYKAAQEQLDYEFKTWMSTYGARAEQLYQMGLSNSGVSDIYGANAYSAYVQASLDLKRAQIEQEQENKALYAQYSAEYDAQQTSMTSAAFNAYASTYTPDQEQSIRVALAAQGLTAEQVENVITQLNNYYSSLPEEQKPNTLPSNETIINDAAVRLAATLFTNEETGASTYTGSEVQKNQIRQVMQLSEYSDIAPYVEKIIAKMDENLTTTKKAEAITVTEEIESADITQVSLASILGLINNARAKYGKESKEYENIFSSSRNLVTKSLKAALNNKSEFDLAYNLAGITQEEWMQMDDSDKMLAIMNAVGAFAKEGILHSSEAAWMFNDWFATELKSIPVEKGKYGDVKSDCKDIIDQIEDFKQKGYLGEIQADRFIETIRGIENVKYNEDVAPIVDAINQALTNMMING